MARRHAARPHHRPDRSTTSCPRLEKQLFEAEWAELRQRLSEGASVEDLLRPASQRRAEALAEMARRSRTAPADGRKPEPLFTVLVDYETFAGRICEMANGTVVTPGTLVDWLDRSWIERVVFDGRSRVMDVGVAQRLFTGAGRRAIEVTRHPTSGPDATYPDRKARLLNGRGR